MSRKPTKSNTSSSTIKSKASTVAKPPPAAVTETLVEKFKNSCTTQHFALVWLDENFDQNNLNCRTLVAQLQTIIKKLDLFNDTDNCIEFINSIRNLDVYLIISNPEEKILLRFHRLEQVKAIFVFDDTNSSKESWIDQWKKIRGAYTSVDALCKSVKETAKDSDNELKELHFISSKDIETRGLDELNQSFMYTQLIKEIILELDYGNECVREFVTYSIENRDKYKPKLQGFEEFQQNYKKQKTPVWWYTRDIFAYEFVNWALRKQEFDAIIRAGFFINDLHRHIAELHENQLLNGKTELVVYRGQGMDKEDFTELRNSKGGLLAFNNFLSTSRDPVVAQGFLSRALKKGFAVGIVFIITLDPSISSAVYAEVDEVSCYEKAEAEILFSLATVFRIGKIRPVQRDPEIWEVELSLTSNEDRELNILMDRIRVEIEGSTPLYKLGALMIKVGQYNKAEEIYSTLLQDTKDEAEKANLNHQLGFIKYKQGNPRRALQLYDEVLKVYQKTIGGDHNNVAAVYNNMGLAYDSLKDYSQALVHYQKAQKIYEKNASTNGPILATCYNNIASIYDQKQDYKQALSYFEKSSQIYETQSSANHPDLATLKNNIGLVHMKTNDYKKALECFQTAVKIGTKTLPQDHADLQAYKEHLKLVNTTLNNKYK